MTFEGAVIREQGVTFAVMAVQSHVLNMRSDADDVIQSFRGVFGGIPVVLMSQDGRGRPTYYGRPDIARFMSGVPLGMVRWKRYTLS